MSTTLLLSKEFFDLQAAHARFVNTIKRRGQYPPGSPADVTIESEVAASRRELDEAAEAYRALELSVNSSGTATRWS